MIWICRIRGNVLVGDTLLWLPSSNPVPPDPEVLARRVVAEMRLQPVRIGSVPKILDLEPEGMGYVGMPVWLWVDNVGPQTSGPQTRTIAENGWSVTATATMKRVVWDMGDSTKVTCGLGVVFDPRLDQVLQGSPSCDHRYEKQAIYDVKATSQWEVTWSGVGQSGVIPLEMTTSGKFRIGEIQTVIK